MEVRVIGAAVVLVHGYWSLDEGGVAGDADGSKTKTALHTEDVH